MGGISGYDFCGWATKNDIKCEDGRIIRKNAFKVNNGMRVPLVWNHKHDTPSAFIGHGILENKDEGVYVYGFFNHSSEAANAKEAVEHGDVTALSIWANNLEEIGKEVIHGVIREVSLVPAGANPGAFIESVLCHGVPMGDDEDEGIFYTNEKIILSHASKEEDDEDKDKNKDEESDEDPKKAGGKTVGEIYDTLTDIQKDAVAVIVGQAFEDGGKGNIKSEDEEEDEMKHNLFDGDGGSKNGGAVISHSAMNEILSDAKKMGSLRDAFEYHKENGVLSHASLDTEGMEIPTGTQNYGFRDPEMLFPDYHNLNPTPEFISRDMSWVQKVMSKVHRSPFSRVRSTFADITEDEARARGYIKGKQKKEEVFTLLKRTTEPQTIYKKQKLDRDDILDITEFDVVAWIRGEMEVMFNEEKARAILIGDGRPADSDDKIKEDRIRPIVSDVSLFNVKVPVTVDASADEKVISKTTINSIIRSRKKYKGSGNPDFYTTEDVLTEMLLLEDEIGHKLYKTEAELATALRVREIIPVEPMEGQTVTWGGEELPLIGIIVNLADYNVGADRNAERAFFDDFDIDFNQYKYLLEGRMSGALIKPFSALTIALKTGTAGGLSD